MKRKITKPTFIKIINYLLWEYSFEGKKILVQTCCVCGCNYNTGLKSCPDCGVKSEITIPIFSLN